MNENSTRNKKDIDKKMVFLVGPPRSGTTWLQGILSNHPEIGTAQESHLFNHFLQPMINSWKHILTFEDGRGGIGLPAYLTEDDFLELLRDTAERVYSNVPEYNENKLFLDKTPDHLRCIADIRSVFPDARIIVLLRKPEDVIESILNAAESWGQNWAPKSTFFAIRKYQYFFSSPGTEELLLSDPGICVVRYESLKACPTTTLKTILKYLNSPVDDRTLQTMLHQGFTLHKYGEFGELSGIEVKEPATFARKKKGSLHWLQKRLISLLLANHSKSYGFSVDSPVSRKSFTARKRS